MDFNYAVQCLIIKYYRYYNTAYIIILMSHDTMVSNMQGFRMQI